MKYSKESKAILIIIGSLFLIPAWQIFQDHNYTIDLFPFIEFQQKPKWYVHYSAYHLTNIANAMALRIIASKYLPLPVKRITTVLLLFAIFRLIEYWLFRHHLNMWPLIVPIAIYSIWTLAKLRTR